MLEFPSFNSYLWQRKTFFYQSLVYFLCKNCNPPKKSPPSFPLSNKHPLKLFLKIWQDSQPPSRKGEWCILYHGGYPIFFNKKWISYVYHPLIFHQFFNIKIYWVRAFLIIDGTNWLWMMWFDLAFFGLTITYFFNVMYVFYVNIN